MTTLLLDEMTQGGMTSRMEARQRLGLIVMPDVDREGAEVEGPDPETWGATSDALAEQEASEGFLASVTYGEPPR